MGRRNSLATFPMAAGVAREMRQKLRMPPEAETMAVFDRDGWRCRWCESRVISIKALKRMAMACPSSFRHGKANEACHGLAMCCAVSLDHVVPHSRGGTNQRDNLITACWPCQFGRGNDTIDRLHLADPRDRQPVIDEWVGCRWFR